MPLTTSEDFIVVRDGTIGVCIDDTKQWLVPVPPHIPALCDFFHDVYRMLGKGSYVVADPLVYD